MDISFSATLLWLIFFSHVNHHRKPVKLINYRKEHLKTGLGDYFSIWGSPSSGRLQISSTSSSLWLRITSWPWNLKYPTNFFIWSSSGNQRMSSAHIWLKGIWSHWNHWGRISRKTMEGKKLDLRIQIFLWSTTTCFEEGREWLYYLFL